MDDIEAVVCDLETVYPACLQMRAAGGGGETLGRQPGPDFISMMSMSEDMDCILRHPLFPRLKRAVLACQQVGHHEAEEVSGDREHVEESIRPADCCNGDITVFMEQYCRLFEQLGVHLEEVDVHLRADMKQYYRELADAITQITPRLDAVETSAPCSDTDRAALRERHRQTIHEVKRKIVQKQKKSRLPDNAVAALKAWWDHNSDHPFPSEAVKKSLCQDAGLTLVQVNNWFINKRKRSKPKMC